MKTKIHKSRTLRHGLLTETERNAIKNDTITRQMKWKLVGKKGRLTIGLKELIKDFETIFRSKKLVNWSYDFLVKEEISKLERVLAGESGFHPIPIERLKVSRKDKLYSLERIVFDEIPRSSERGSYFFQKMTKGLKQNEKNLILDHFEKTGNYNLPLEGDKKYSWKEVKQKLKDDLKPVDLSEVRKAIESEDLRRKDEAWKIYNSRLTVIDKRKLAELGIYFQAYATIGFDK